MKVITGTIAYSSSKVTKLKKPTLVLFVSSVRYARLFNHVVVIVVTVILSSWPWIVVDTPGGRGHALGKSWFEVASGLEQRLIKSGALHGMYMGEDGRGGHPALG